MSFIRTAVFSQAGGAAWALGHAQSFPQPGKRWWKYFQQTVDCVRQHLNWLPGAAIQVGWERLFCLQAEWMGFVCFRKEIQDPWVNGLMWNPLRSIGRHWGSLGFGDRAQAALFMSPSGCSHRRRLAGVPGSGRAGSASSAFSLAISALLP